MCSDYGRSRLVTKILSEANIEAKDEGVDMMLESNLDLLEDVHFCTGFYSVRLVYDLKRYDEEIGWEGMERAQEIRF